eukprot:21529_4
MASSRFSMSSSRIQSNGHRWHWGLKKKSASTNDMCQRCSRGRNQTGDVEQVLTTKYLLIDTLTAAARLRATTNS